MMSRERLLEILCRLPAVRLELIDLVWKLVDDSGQLDETKVAFHYIEVEQAAAQAEEQAKATGELVRSLENLLNG